MGSQHARICKCSCAANALAGMDIDDADPCHVELTKAQRTRDFVDLQKLLGWFAAHNPLDVSDSRLRNVGTGVVAGDDDKITCDTAEDVGHTIMVSMDDKPFADVVMRKANQVWTLSELTKKVKTGSSVVSDIAIFVLKRDVKLQLTNWIQ